MRDRDAKGPAGQRISPSIVLILVFIVLGAAIIAGGALTYLRYERQYRAQVEQQLSAVADLKVAELVEWRKERLGDAAVFLNDQPFVVLVRQMMDHPEDTGLRARVMKLLGIIRSSYKYERILVLDRRARILTSDPGSEEAEATGGPPTLDGIIAAGRIVLLDFHRDAPGMPIHLAVVVPLREEKPGAEPFAAIVLRIDPRAYLYPFIMRWPTPSRTAETLLVRREGDEVLFLNDLRFRPGSALAFRLPLADRSLPAAAAVCGYTGIMNGRDYRGVPVFADVRPVPDSPWFLVARQDAAEVFAPLKERLWLMIGLVAALLFGTAAAAVGVWRQFVARSYRERYEAEKRLRVVSARQEALYAAIPDIIMEVDADKKYVWANHAGLDFFGEDVVGREAASYFEGEQETYRTVQPLFNGRENVICVESWQRRKDGARRLLAWWCRVLKDEKGRVTGALSSARDVTEQNKAEEENRKLLAAVQQEKSGLSALIDSITDEVWFADAQGRFTLANPAALKEFGIDPESVVEVEQLAKSLEVLRPDGSPRPVEEAPPLRAVAGEVVRNQEELVRTPAHAELRYRQVSASPVKDSTGRIIGSVSVVRDITERKKAEEAVRRSEAFLGTIIDKSPLAMWVSDENGTMLRLNQALKDLLQIREEEVVGRYNVFQDDIVERQGYMPLVRNVFAKGEIAKFPLVYDTATLQHLRWAHQVSVILEITISPVKGPDGRVTNAIIQVVDVTERVRAVEALQASLKEKEVLLREIHHRVKNNMQVISSLLNLQGSQVADPQVRNAFKESQLRIRSMALVHERLYGSGDLSHIDFAEYLRKLCIHLGQAFAIASDRIGIRFDLEPISLDINSAIPCGLIATELIANAMKHAFPDGRRGTIVVALKRAGDGRIRMTIADDGVGFPAGLDFWTADSLGMQIVNLLSQQIEGRVELAAGPGTSFSVEFPEVLYKKRL